ncbi:hypothetical protein AVEN_94041-1, partial [Araneus ventricosus]
RQTVPPSGKLYRHSCFVVRFGASVSGLPKSIDWNEWNAKQLLVQLEKNSVVVNAQLYSHVCEHGCLDSARLRHQVPVQT